MFSINAAHCLYASVIRDSLNRYTARSRKLSELHQETLQSINDPTWRSPPFMVKMNILLPCKISRQPYSRRVESLTQSQPIKRYSIGYMKCPPSQKRKILPRCTDWSGNTSD